jgi:hypothetical protein
MIQDGDMGIEALVKAGAHQLLFSMSIRLS